MILRGVEQATFINSIVTVAKIVPIIVAIIGFVFFFNYSHFSENFFGGVGMPEKSLLAQVRDTMLITVFVFLGIEGASVYSRFAKARSDVGSATILGFVAVTGLMVAVTLLPYATAPRAAIAGVQNPSLASALELVVGHWGAVLISIGVLVSVLGAYLAWSLICAEVLFAAAKSKDMPRLFAAQNGNRVPANALWLTNIVVSLFVTLLSANQPSSFTGPNFSSAPRPPPREGLSNTIRSDGVWPMFQGGSAIDGVHLAAISMRA